MASPPMRSMSLCASRSSVLNALGIGGDELKFNRRTTAVEYKNIHALNTLADYHIVLEAAKLCRIGAINPAVDPIATVVP